MEKNNSNKPVIAILGATGAVGTQMLEVMEERNFEIKDLKLLAHANDAGKTYTFKGKKYVVEEAVEKSFENVDITLIAVDGDISKKFMPFILNSGSVAIDNSSAFRLNDDVPLVVPEVNPEDIKTHKGIIANPNCSTIIALVAINELYKYAGIKRMIVSTYQAVSGAGILGIEELKNQTAAVLSDKESESKVFQHEIAFNIIPHIDSFEDNNYTKEEMKMHNEGRKILHDNNISISCTCARVPVIRSHSESITIETEKELTVEKVKELLSNSKGVKLVDDPKNNIYPMPLDTSGQDLVYVGRVRKDFSGENSISLWCCGDQIRKGAATNAVQIAELLVENGLNK